MKKFLLTAIVLSFCSFLFAQDIIVKRDGTRIDAIVQTVGEKEIGYKRLDNQDGPIYTISVSEVATIIYKNGKVDTFTAQQSTTVTESQSTTANNTDKVSPYMVPQAYYYRTDAMKAFCPECYDYLGTASRLNTGGAILLGFGIAGDIIGIVGYAVGSYTMGAVGLGIGVPCTAASIPLLCVGSYKYRKAKEAYDKCIREYNSSNNYNGFSLDLQGSKDGVGIALKF